MKNLLINPIFSKWLKFIKNVNNKFFLKFKETYGHIFLNEIQSYETDVMNPSCRNCCPNFFRSFCENYDRCLEVFVFSQKLPCQI